MRKNVGNQALLVLVAGLLPLSAADAAAQVRSFDGGGDGFSWTDPLNWSGDDAPDTNLEDASIDAGGAWDVSLSGPNLTINTLTLGSDDALTVSNRLTTATTATTATVTGDITVNTGGFFTSASSWVNEGTLTVNETGIVATSGGSTTITNAATGTVQGAAFFNPLGVITNTFFNNGTIAPGFGPEDANGVGFAANLVLGSTSVVEIEIGGGTTASTFDYVSAALSLQLGGELQLVMFDGYEPDETQAYEILYTPGLDQLSGQFTNIANGERLFTTDGSGSWIVNYGPNSAFSTNNVVISDFEPIPEPQSLGILLAGGLALFRRHR